MLPAGRGGEKMMLSVRIPSIEFNLDLGKVLGIIGPENSGKSNLLNQISGQSKPSKGQILFFNKNVSRESNHKISYFAEGNILPGFLSVKDLLDFHQYFYPDFSKKVAFEMLETFKINPQKLVSQYTLQQQELIKIVLTFSRDTTLYLLDNPFKMVETIHEKELSKILFSIVNENRSIIITARDIAPLELVCDDLMILSDGRIAFFGNAEDFRMNRKQSISDYYQESVSK
jgi:ABC-2 type transport system ATP-binding protein